MEYENGGFKVAKTRMAKPDECGSYWQWGEIDWRARLIIVNFGDKFYPGYIYQEAQRPLRPAPIWRVNYERV